jgi:16S rRNA (cytidine1402-2'-O)-methyltransferase
VREKPRTDTSGILYVVATPIGNLGDMSPRALAVLTEVAVVAAEDTRHSGQLLAHFGIQRPMLALHEHNERQRVPRLIERLRAGESVALVSDAGTPLISDPGFHLVRAAREAQITVVPIPGASAAIAALSASGLPSDRFVFEGFLPAAGERRRRRLEALRAEPRTLIFFESPHRIDASLRDMSTVLGGERRAVVARELTKRFETFYLDTLEALCVRFAGSAEERRGELVVLIAGAPEIESAAGMEPERVLRILLAELPLKQAVRLAAALTGAKKRVLYALALRLAAPGAG